MASSRSGQGSTGVGASASSDPSVVRILPTTRTKEVFEHFDLCEMSDGTEKARCKGCGGFLKPESNSTLRNHLARHCPARKNNPGDDQAQINAECGIWTFDHDMAREMMGNLIIQEALPFNHFDNPRLTRMIQKALQPRYKQVSRTTIRRDCLKRWREAKKQLILGFQNLKTGVNLTTDVWSAHHGLSQSYLCVTAHWIDPDTWQMMKRTIAFEMFAYPHTGENLFYMLDGIIQTFHLQEKILSISFDNASNNTNCVRKLILKYQPLSNGVFFHTRCVAHIINLVVQDGLAVPQMNQVKERFKQMLKDIFANSRKRFTDYQKLCEDTNSIFLGPYWDIPTRWNSTWRMFDNAIRQRPTLQCFHEGLAERRRVRRLPALTWDFIEQITSLLENFKEATTTLSGVYYPTSCLVLYQIFAMANKINEYQSLTEIYTTMLLPMKVKLLKYFQELPAVFTCATALNPCYNGSGVETLIEDIVGALGLQDPNFATTAKNNFNTYFQNMFDFYLNKYGSTSTSNIQQTMYASSSSSATNIKIDLYNRLRSNVNKRARGTNASSELGRYLGTDWINSMNAEDFDKFDILAWWKERESQFPILAAMARDLLSVQASTVASESTFCLSGRVLSIRRTRLTPASLEMCICLKDHLDAMERVQHKSNLEGELEVEEPIYEVEVEDGMALPLSDEEQAMDEWMRQNSPELQSEVSDN